MLISALVLSSCATIFLGRKQQIMLNSEPEGAKIYVNGTDINKTTPCLLELKRRVKPSRVSEKNEYVFKFQKKGMHELEIKDKARANVGGVALMILESESIVPLLVDLGVGMHLKYNKKQNAILHPNSVTQTIVKETIVLKDPIQQPVYEYNATSDVDQNIPVLNNTNPNRFALIIGNEDYTTHQSDLSSEVNVEFAKNDAFAFKAYAENMLGIPKENIIFLIDATAAKMKQGVNKMNLLIKNSQSKADVFVYYAGHGLPEENTKEPYLIPVDVSGTDLSMALSINELYNKMIEYPSARITVILDACFSGGARNQGLVSARSIKVKPKDPLLNSKLIVFAASSGEQSSLPYKEKKHGMFTYFLLKKLQESSNHSVTYNELSEYISSQVGLKSVLINDKEQNPQVNISPALGNEWKEYLIK